MKKQLLLLTVVGGALAVAAPQVQAQAPLPSIYFNPDTATNPDGSAVNPNAANKTANVITVNGNIPEFIQFNVVDNVIELGDIGGPVWNSANKGPVRSVAGRSNSNASGPGSPGNENFNKDTNTDPGQGDAEIELRANTYVRVKFSGAPLRNIGPDGQTGTAQAPGDDTVLPTSYRFAVKGKVKFASGDNAEANYNNYPKAIGQNPVPPGFGGAYAYYSAPVVSTNDATGAPDINFTYAPGAPVNTGSGTNDPDPVPNTDPNAYSGFRFMAEVTRNGLNDYKGAYSTQINLAYYKY